MEALGRPLLLIGVVLVVLGLLLQLAPSLPLLGKLPGDLRLQWGGLRIYLPLTSCLLLSLALSGLLQLLARLR